jgi:predicted glycosyltransferase
MRLLFDLGHPAHVHLFRNLINRVIKDGGEVLAATRDKDLTIDLCKAYNIPQVVLSRAYSGKFIAGVWEFLFRTIKLFQIALKFKPDALLGTSMSIGVVGRLIRRPTFFFSEDDADLIPIIAKFVYPTCKYIVTPDSLKHEGHGQKHLCYPGYHELAYLHPSNFTPNPEVPRSMGLNINKPYFILRFVSLKAHHDTGASGLSLRVAKKLVKLLFLHGRVVITSEAEIADEFKKYAFPLAPDKIHDVLSFASMYIGDSQTMTIEAAVLGVPCLRCNTFVGRISCLNELEKDYGLTKGFLPEESNKLLATVNEWLADLEDIRDKMQNRRNKMLTDKIDLADWQWAMLCEKLSI